MTPAPASIGLAIAGIVFLAFVLFKLLSSGPRRDERWQAAHREVLAARARARDRSLAKADRAAALREAARIALAEMGRPSLAASYARRAERLDPGDAEAVGLLAASLRRASRYRALERFLWRHLASEADTAGEAHQRVLSELCKLYEGPLRRPEIARALRRLVPRG